jgi:hypothetical protein
MSTQCLGTCFSALLFFVVIRCSYKMPPTHMLQGKPLCLLPPPLSSLSGKSAVARHRLKKLTTLQQNKQTWVLPYPSSLDPESAQKMQALAKSCDKLTTFMQLLGVDGQNNILSNLDQGHFRCISNFAEQCRNANEQAEFRDLRVLGRHLPDVQGIGGWYHHHR